MKLVKTLLLGSLLVMALVVGCSSEKKEEPKPADNPPAATEQAPSGGDAAKSE